MAYELYVLCESREEATGRIRSLAAMFGHPDEDNVDLTMPRGIKISVRASRASDAPKPVQVHVICPNADQLTRAKAALERRRCKRIRWPFASAV